MLTVQRVLSAETAVNLINTSWARYVDKMADVKIVVEEYQAQLDCDRCGLQVVVSREKYLHAVFEGGALCSRCGREGVRHELTLTMV